MGSRRAHARPAGRIGLVKDPFSSVIGQPKAVEQLRAAANRPVHAYLFVGPAGSGKRTAARAFAAALLGDDRPLDDLHPDVSIVEREGASINVAQAREIGRLAARSPMEGDRKVLVLTEFHLVDEAAPALLKTIEEASETTVFVILTDSMTRELVTVASRCVKIDFCALSNEAIESALLAEGCDAEHAKEAAASAFGNLDRARLLVADDTAVERRRLWSGVPGRLDGTGAMAAKLADEVVSSLDAASKPLVERQAAEQERVQARAKEVGQAAGTAMKNLETKHKRELRRLRTDELRAGFATLAREFGGKAQHSSDGHDSAAAMESLEALTWASESLTFNPNESLLLQGLFVRLTQAANKRIRRAG